jgi:hypothetical protein
MQRNAYIGSRFANYAVMLDLPLGELYQKAAYYNAVTPDNISAMMKKITARKMVRVTLAPEV